jgi:O-succinylbenzoic acid--CoA ligase
MGSYPFDTIWINGREVPFTSILSKEATAFNDFESNTFEFIRQWLTNTPSFIIHTSGSTGTPKPITVKREQMLASAYQTQQALGYPKSGSALICLDPAYIAGKMMIVRSLEAGLKIFAITPSVHVLEKLPDDVTIDLVALVPYQLTTILENNQTALFKRIRKAIIGGAPLSIESKKQLEEIPTQFYATYGMTETISHIALQQLNGMNASDVYTVLPDILISLDDRQCLCIKAPYLEELIVTNDLVELINHQQFRWLGRIDHVINSGGVKIILDSLENKIQTILHLQRLHYRFFLTGVPDHLLGEKLVMIIEGKLTDTQTNALILLLKEHLTPYEVPKSILSVNEFVLTSTGKIDRKKTREILTNSL